MMQEGWGSPQCWQLNRGLKKRNATPTSWLVLRSQPLASNSRSRLSSVFFNGLCANSETFLSHRLLR